MIVSNNPVAMCRKYRFLLIVVAVLLSLQIQAQKTRYKLKKDISYRAVEDVKSDKYIAERCKLDIYFPVNKKSFTTVVWFHGGGLTGGQKSIPELLKEKGIAVVAVNYRLYPKVKCPTYINDAAAAVAWTFKNIHEWGGDPAKIIVSGHSAGGYLTSMLGLDKSYLAEFGVDADRIAMLVPFSGHAITHFTVRKEMGIAGEQPIIDQYAPLFHVRKDAPPLVLITGDRELEMLGRYEENAYMYRMMKVVGHPNTRLYELETFNHGTMVSPALELLLKEIHSFNESNL
jgi:acetyl esterase/lipase